MQEGQGQRVFCNLFCIEISQAFKVRRAMLHTRSTVIQRNLSCERDGTYARMARRGRIR